MCKHIWRNTKCDTLGNLVVIRLCNKWDTAMTSPAAAESREVMRLFIILCLSQAQVQEQIAS